MYIIKRINVGRGEKNIRKYQMSAIKVYYSGFRLFVLEIILSRM